MLDALQGCGGRGASRLQGTQRTPCPPPQVPPRRPLREAPLASRRAVLLRCCCPALRSELRHPVGGNHSLCPCPLKAAPALLHVRKQPASCRFASLHTVACIRMRRRFHRFDSAQPPVAGRAGLCPGGRGRACAGDPAAGARADCRGAAGVRGGPQTPHLPRAGHREGARPAPPDARSAPPSGNPAVLRSCRRL